MEEDSEFEDERQRCILLLDFIISSMTDNVKDKITLEGYTPLQLARFYILDQIKADESTQGIVHADNVVDKYESLSFLFIFDYDGSKIVDVLF